MRIDARQGVEAFSQGAAQQPGAADLQAGHIGTFAVRSLSAEESQQAVVLQEDLGRIFPEA